MVITGFEDGFGQPDQFGDLLSVFLGELLCFPSKMSNQSMSCTWTVLDVDKRVTRVENVMSGGEAQAQLLLVRVAVAQKGILVQGR